MRLNVRDSGLAVPVTTEQNRHKHIKHGLEILDPEMRDKAIDAMNELWEAMSLTNNDPDGIQEHRRNLWTCFGEMMLGYDLPEHEIHT